MGDFCFSGFILFPKPLSLRRHDPVPTHADNSGGEEIDASDDPSQGPRLGTTYLDGGNDLSWQALCVNGLDLQPATWDAAQNSSEKSISLARQNMPPLPISRDGSKQPKDKASHRTHIQALMPLRLKLQIPPVHIVSTVKCSADGLGTIEAGHPVPETSTTRPYTLIDLGRAWSGTSVTWINSSYNLH
ncbi:uncharacterized protein Triagg1_1127 [Trichoderma aggressivum f. europaeum]|uniref:Uncharacterized protein n=1 Tax=Trichoderma aggressivum f. europaeum TaxID=173218 RepID=A0AAE1II89_9HYPO|nr:hypothetical protein Triagg1_1127 [Trichoderma aggressivum f. europaeum]